MKKLIGLIGMKGTGKDFVANTFFPKYKNFAIADSVKIESAINLGYLEKDDKYLYDNFSKHKEALQEELDSQNLGGLSIFDFKDIFMSKSTKSLSKENILLKVNIYKNLDFLVTRDYLYGYFEVEKEFGYEHISKKAFEQIDKIKEDVIITDIRTILESIDLLLNGGLLINLYNSRSIDFYKNLEFFHFSEYEIAAPLENKNFIGFSIDITSRDKSYLKKIFSKIEDSFYGRTFGIDYSLNFINSLEKLRKEILEKDNINEIEEELTDLMKLQKGGHFVLEEYKEAKKPLDSYRTKLFKLIDTEYKNIFIF